MDMFPGIENPTRADRIGAEVADEQLKLIFGLRKIRMDRSLSVVDVAEIMGVDPAQVSRFESGSTNPTMSTIRRYAKAVEAVFRVRVQSYDDERTQVVGDNAAAAFTIVTSDDESHTDEAARWSQVHLLSTTR
ncbi:helix-turn-helix domain-containing protein [Mycobacteroides abscessus]|uniref:helix-turn-helix domain-containing protein n=1 Tax=Mycobacteroides abscessus TaxID=36809 RepID=UPI0009A5AA5B|nr:helix-turn-helix domain-containing protein [Mycobacteroides abscessus]SKQ12391.1 Antitoxin HigA [Mycobacteroides abscessus subsp. massiliense]